MGGNSASSSHDRNAGVKLFGVTVESRLGVVSKNSADGHEQRCEGVANDMKRSVARYAVSSASADYCTKVEPGTAAQQADRDAPDDLFPEESDNSFVGGSADAAAAGPMKMCNEDTEGIEAVATGPGSVRVSASSRERKKGDNLYFGIIDCVTCSQTEIL